MTTTKHNYIKTWTLFLLLLAFTATKLNAQSSTTYTWAGATGTDWNTASNWTPIGVPTNIDNVVIPNGTINNPKITNSNGNITLNNLDIEGELDFANKNTLTINGYLRGAGSMHFAFVQIRSYDYTTEIDSIILSATNNTIGSLIPKAGVGIIISGPLTITKELQLTCGTYQGNGSSIGGSKLITGNQLTLASTSYVDFAGYIPHFPLYQPSISGTVTIQKLIPKGFKAFRDLGVAVAGGPTIRQVFNDNSTYSYTNSTWSDILDPSIALNPMQGYRTLVDASSSNVTISYSGTLLTEDQSPTLTSGQDVFSFIANPYQSQVDFSKVINNYSNGLYNGYWYLDPKTLYHGYEQFNYFGTDLGVSNIYSSNPASGFLQSGQGFFVCSNTSGTPTLTFTEDSKNNSNTQLNIFGTTTSLNRIATGLFTNGKNVDGAVVVFNSNFNNAVGKEDGLKKNNQGENLSFEVAGKDLCANGWSLPVVTDALPLHLYNLNTNTAYKLRLDASQFEGNGLQAILKDNFLGTQTWLAGDSNIVSFTTTTDTATYSSRYSILFSPSILPVNSISLSTTTLQGNEVSVKWSVVGESNIINYIVEHSVDGINFTDLASVIPTFSNTYNYIDKTASDGINYYRIKLTDNNGVVSYSNILSTQLIVHNYQFSIFPNPAKDKVTIQGNHISFVHVIDNVGRVVKVVSLKDASNPNLSVNSLKEGAYHLKIQTTDGKVSEVVFVKE